MFDQLDARSPTPLYEQIAQRVRAAIAAGEARPGTRMPSVRQLATDLRVNPATVAQAYRQLERDGFVSSRRGMGTYVNAISSDRRDGERAEQAQQLARELIDEGMKRGISGAELQEALAAELAGTSPASGATTRHRQGATNGLDDTHEGAGAVTPRGGADG